jgi:hypothetical protein
MAGGLMANDAGDNARTRLDAYIDTVEAGYEFFLAYAAQGRRSDRGQQGDSGLRQHLDKMDDALGRIAATARICVEERDAELVDAAAAFFDAFANDASTAQAAVRLVLARPDISSQLIDNLNASIHLRALLTDVFIIDEALKQRAAG